jgi:hypothetical protein
MHIVLLLRGYRVGSPIPFGEQARNVYAPRVTGLVGVPVKVSQPAQRNRPIARWRVPIGHDAAAQFNSLRNVKVRSAQIGALRAGAGVS